MYGVHKRKKLVPYQAIYYSGLSYVIIDSTATTICSTGDYEGGRYATYDLVHPRIISPISRRDLSYPPATTSFNNDLIQQRCLLRCGSVLIRSRVLKIDSGIEQNLSRWCNGLRSRATRRCSKEVPDTPRRLPWLRSSVDCRAEHRNK
jgi:hypothetical protein